MNIKRRAKQLLIPYFIWSFLHYLKGPDYSVDMILNMIVQPDIYYWFLWILFGLCMIFIFSGYIAFKFCINEDYLIILINIVLIAIMVIANPRFLGFQLLSWYLLFFSFGYFMHKKRLFEKCSYYFLFSLTVLWAFLALDWHTHELPFWFPNIPHLPDIVSLYMYRGTTAILAIVVLINGAKRFWRSQFFIAKSVEWVGKYSLGFYVIHLIYLSYCVTIIKLLIPGINMAGQIVFVLILDSLLTIATLSLILANKKCSFLIGKS